MFNNVDEHAHVDLVLKYARGHWPNKPLERFDASAGRLFVLYGTPEYFYAPEQLPGGVIPRPLWETPAIAHRAVRQGVVLWTNTRNYEANSPPTYYALAGAWYNVGGWLGLTEGARLYWIRFLNVPLLALLVFFSYVFCRTFYPDRLDLLIGLPLLLAFLPQDAYYSVTSDALSPPLFLVSLMLLLQWYRRTTPGTAFSALVGFLIALTFLVKFTNIALPVIFAVMVLIKIHQSRRRGRWKAVLWCCSVAVLTAAMPIALCLGRNYVLLGDLTGSRAHLELFGLSRRPFDSFLAHPIFSPSGFWTFWSGLMTTFWRGELAWHLKSIASPSVDAFYAISSTVMLLGAAASWRSRTASAVNSQVDGRGIGAAVYMAVWASVTLSWLVLACSSVWFDYGESFYPSRQKPYFMSARLIGGALVPFLFLYMEGVAFLLRPLSRVVAPLCFVALVSVMMTVSELALSSHIVTNPFNWFHLPVHFEVLPDTQASDYGAVSFPPLLPGTN